VGARQRGANADARIGDGNLEDGLRGMPPAVIALRPYHATQEVAAVLHHVAQALDDDVFDGEARRFVTRLVSCKSSRPEDCASHRRKRAGSCTVKCFAAAAFMSAA
jgi:hypothetical protein